VYRTLAQLILTIPELYICMYKYIARERAERKGRGIGKKEGIIYIEEERARKRKRY
jgi:hypothetical protein